MSTFDLARQAGFLAVLGLLLLTLTVVTLRLLALPAVLVVLILDRAADLAAQPLSFTTPPGPAPPDRR